MKATENLREEHEGIKLMLKIMGKIVDDLEKGKDLQNEHFEKIIDFNNGFIEKCHHMKEEGILFPTLEEKGIAKKGGPIGMMLHEHQLGREFNRNLSNAFNEYKNGNESALSGIISNTKDYIQLLRSHIEKENDVLFMMANKVLDKNLQSEMFKAFEKYEEDVIGAGKHEEYHKLLKELKNMYL
jgi:hemerythrin-like domain-containing protein